MIEAVQLANLFNNLVNWLGLAARHKSENEEQYKNALLRVYLAANETRAYISTLKRRKMPDKEKEMRLSRLWSEAAVEIRQIDRKLAQQCLLRGEYWSDVTSWSHKDIDMARESLNEVFNRAKDLL